MPPEIIVAIIGVETYYGRNIGSYRVIDALATLAFDYPRRAPFFRGELKEYVLLARDQGFSPLVPKGSFAGAMGVPQFMPGSYRRFAVDFDGDGHVDLWRSNADVVGSIANYLARHDWQRGQPVLLPAVIAPEARERRVRRLDGGISERRPLRGVGGRRRERRATRPPTSRPIPSDCCCSRKATPPRRRRDEPLDRVPQLLRDHALQQEPPVRIGRLLPGRAPAPGALTWCGDARPARAAAGVSARSIFRGVRQACTRLQLVRTSVAASQQRTYTPAMPDAAADRDLPLKEDTRLLGRMLGDVVRAQTGDEAFARVEAIRQTAIRFRRAEDGAGARGARRALARC